MSPDDFRHLLNAAGGLSNREAADALGMDERLVRRLKSGAETIGDETAARLIDLAADALALQMLRALSAAAGRVDIARLSIRDSAVHIDGADVSPPAASALRAAVLAALESAGLRVETEGGQ